MLTDLLQELRNWFPIAKHTGTFTIQNGNITADFLAENQYFRIIGSIFSDGVHQYPATDLVEETFTGAVWALAIPQAVINLSTEIDAWQTKYGGADSAAMSPYNSESFGGYSYSKSGSGTGGVSAGADWKAVFSSQLNRWRKI